MFVRRVFPKVEYYSIDEFFFRVSTRTLVAETAEAMRSRHLQHGARAGDGRHRRATRRSPS